MNEIKTNPTTANYQRDLPIHERLNNRSVAVIQEIVADNEKRMKGYKGDVKLLDSGCFYANQYFKALKETNNGTRCNWFLNKGSFYHGFASSKHFNMAKNPLSPTDTKVNLQILKKDVTPCEGLEA